MATNVQQVQTLYVAFLGRPADPVGLAYWLSAIQQNSASALTALKDALAGSAEFAASYAGLSVGEQLDQACMAILHRHMEPAGYDFWVTHIQKGDLTLSDFITVAGNDAQEYGYGGFNFKIAAAIAFTNALDTTAEQAGYSSAGAAALAKAFIASIDDDASLANALANLAETVSQVTNAPVNHAPTGSVLITGTAIEGQVLTASHTLDDADGLGAVSYRWQAGGINISGATGSTLTLTAAQVGKPITVLASYTDGIGTHEVVSSNTIASGNDTIAGTAGVDTMAGGTGNDTYTVNVAGDVIVEKVDEGTDQVNVALASGSYTLSANVENATVTSSAAVGVVGNALDNVLTGNAATNTLTGNAGNDILDGGAGADKLIGGTGDDIYLVDNANDVVTENANEGADTVRTTLSTLALAANVEYLVYTGSSSFSGTGNALNNVITGGDQGNKLDGGAGNDVLAGGAGADSLTGGLGNDSFRGAAGLDTIDGGDGNDMLQGLGNFADYTITRPNATDTVLTDKSGNVTTVRNVEFFEFADTSRNLTELQFNIKSVGNDTLVGTDGNDSIDGLAGADVMIGGKGNDIYVIDNVGDAITENGDEGTDLAQVALTSAGTYVLGSNVENATVTAAASVAVNLTGNGMSNALTGNAAANTLTGGAGNDTLDGGAGADKLIGGIGDDTYVVDNSGDAITENAGEGTDTVRTSLATYTLGANLENLAYTGAAAFTGTGNALDNAITGGDKGNKLDGGAGNDQLTGGLGNDSLVGGLGDDTFIGAAGKDTIDGGAGNDSLQGLSNFEDYTVTRPTANDTVLTDKAGNVVTVRNVEFFEFADTAKNLSEIHFNVASVGNDTLVGTDGNDSMNGFAGADFMSGGKGDDIYVVDNVGDTIAENGDEGTDLVQVALVSAGTYVLGSNVENATVTAVASVAANITGNGMANILTGNAAANTLIGGAGDDTLDGGAGADKLLGGVGDDTYVVDNSGDTVTEGVSEGTDEVLTSLATYVMGANIENLKYTGAAAFTGTGNALDNVIYGGDKGNKIDGGAGSDVLVGGAGNDTVLGGIGDDAYVHNAGKDTFDGGAGTDMLFLPFAQGDYAVSRPTTTDTVLTDKFGNSVSIRNVENVHFGTGDTTVSVVDLQDNIASPGNDSLVGTDGKDTINGGAGTDTLVGYAGDDTYVIGDKSSVIIENADGGIDTVQVALTAAGTYQLAANVEHATVTAAAGVAVNLTGNALDNKLTGNAAANTLVGGAGNDTIDGGAGADKMIGGAGSDDYYVSDAGDVVTELAGEGSDFVFTTLSSYALTANVEGLLYTGSGAFTGTGNAENNLIDGGNGGAKLDGGAGNDMLHGGMGNDSVQGGLGDDTIVASIGKDTVDGGAGDDLLSQLDDFDFYKIVRVSATDVLLTHVTGASTLVRNVETFNFNGTVKALAEVVDNTASPNNDVIVGTDHDDVLDGGAGNDTMTGGAGDDTYVLSAPGDTLVELVEGGYDGVELAFTAAGSYTMAANVEFATVTAAAGVAVSVVGNALDNYLTGNAAANTLSGGIGDDTLNGGAGNDTLVGGAGDDYYLVGEAGDVVKENANEGYDKVFASVATYTLSANVEEVVFIGKGAVSGVGNDGNNRLFSGSATSAKLDGGVGNDTLIGNAGNDSMLGGAGDDWFQASGGNDTADGGAGIDGLFNLGAFEDYTIRRPNATDTVLTDKAGNTYTARGVENFYFANAVVKTLAQLQDNVASIGNDSLLGTDGDDVMDGGAGVDTLVGGTGDDVYTVDNAADLVVEDADAGYDFVWVNMASGSYAMPVNVEDSAINSAGAVSITGNALDNIILGNAAANKLTGGDGNDTLAGGAGNDTLLGGAGNDSINGGVGVDSMVGGAGDDIYNVANVGDLVVEAAGEGTDLVILSGDAAKQAYAMTANVENLRFEASGAFRATGNALDNVIDGKLSTGAVIDGGAGNDVVYGGAGNDSLAGGVGDDAMVSGAGIDTIDGGAGSDTAWLAGAFADYVVARPNATDLVLSDRNGNVTTVRNVEFLHFADATLAPGALVDNVATTGADALEGTAGSDTLDGLAGNDTLAGGDGNDLYVVNAAGDVIVEQADQGIDKVNVAFTAAGTYVLSDNVEHATVTAAAGIAVNVTGNALDNWLIGNAAANTLLGGDGDDTLNGGAGSDSLVGGAGDDLYVVDATGDKVVEAADAGYDRVDTSLASYVLTANVEGLHYTDTAAFTGTGNGLANVIQGGVGADTLGGMDGNDYLIGGAGSDKLAGGNGADTFVLNSLVGSDTITDFVSGTDVLQLDLEALAIGDRDATMDGAVTRSASGGFGTHAELVLFTQKMASASTANAAAVIGSASSAYEAGETALFAVSTSNATVLYRFQSAGNDALVSANELAVVATLAGTPTTTLSDYFLSVST